MSSSSPWALMLPWIAVSLFGCEVPDGDPVEVTDSVVLPAGTPRARPPAPVPSADPLDPRLTGTIDGEPFVARGALAQRRRASDPTIEIRLLDRHASCASFEADYESREGEPIVIVYLEWPRGEGDRVPFRAREVHERLQFCEGNERGRASCQPRAPEQGSVTVLEASPEGGVLSFEVESPRGTLSGQIPFTLC